MVPLTSETILKLGQKKKEISIEGCAKSVFCLIKWRRRVAACRVSGSLLIDDPYE